MCLKYCMWNRECQKYGVLSNRQLIKFYLWYEDFQPHNEDFPFFFFSFFNSGQFMPDEVTDRAGWLAHPFCFPRFNDRVRTRGVSHPQPQVPIWSLLLAPLTSLVPFLRPLLMMGSVTGMMSPLLSLQPHFRTPPQTLLPMPRGLLWPHTAPTPNTPHSGSVRCCLRQLPSPVVLVGLICLVRVEAL